MSTNAHSLKMLSDFEDAPKYWDAYKSFCKWAIAFVISIIVVLMFKGSLFPAIVSVALMFVSIDRFGDASGSTKKHMLEQYEEYLETLKQNQLIALIEEPCVDSETREFVIEYVQEKKIWLKQSAY